ncbi:hypothetical protein C4565_08550 [Candidatus Parcubacteria bacterium]|jgi:hypothetical protein|nr:MAG: hypothetical protein C4565_08550 [Candidatus Parcubacteria bacterium]
MKISGYFFISRRLLDEIRQLRAQTLKDVLYILSECADGMKKEMCLCEDVEKEIFIFADALAFDLCEKRFYKIINSSSSKKRSITLLEDEDIELILQRPRFMERLEEIYNMFQENKKKGGSE